MSNRKAGEIFIITKKYSHKYKICRKCGLHFKEGDKVMAFSQRGGGNPKYARLKHIECSVDAHGEPLYE